VVHVLVDVAQVYGFAFDGTLGLLVVKVLEMVENVNVAAAVEAIRALVSRKGHGISHS
jgi:hypothetical protein